MTFDWRNLPNDDVERHFNPRNTVPDPQALLDEYARKSAETRNEIRGRYDLRYGKGEKETLDLHLPYGAPNGTLVVFIHGGYWRGLDKSDHSFVVPTFTEAGTVLANVNYDLCPSVTLDTMVEEIERAVLYCHGNAREWGADPARLFLVGHSAGAHLAASMLINDWSRHDLPAGPIRGLVGLTGIYEPEVILRVSVNEEARIAPEVAARHDCLIRPPRGNARVLVAAGGGEPQGWIDQTRAYAAVCASAGLDAECVIVEGVNHFSLLERAVTGDTPLNRSIHALIRG